MSDFCLLGDKKCPTPPNTRQGKGDGVSLFGAASFPCLALCLKTYLTNHFMIYFTKRITFQLAAGRTMGSPALVQGTATGLTVSGCASVFSAFMSS